MPPAERSPNEEEQRHEVSDQPLSLDATRLEQVRAFSLVNSAVNVTLLAFAAAAPLLLQRPAPVAIDRYLLPAGPTAANCGCGRRMGQRDGRTDGHRTVT